MTAIFVLSHSVVLSLFFFFFQAEDGIRDKLVTGVQTCALPIYETRRDEDEGERSGEKSDEGEDGRVEDQDAGHDERRADGGRLLRGPGRLLLRAWPGDDELPDGERAERQSGHEREEPGAGRGRRVGRTASIAQQVGDGEDREADRAPPIARHATAFGGRSAP